MIFELLATLCASVFTGAAVYINIVEHPVRMSLGPRVALAEWRPAYGRGAMMQAPLAVLGFLAAVVAWATGGDVAWLAGGALLGAVVPFTLFVTAATNRELLGQEIDQDLARARALLQRWNRLHSVRSALSFTALVIFLMLLR